jgi:integrase
VLDSVPCDQQGFTDHALYLTAAMSGLRQGELLALRWLDVDLGAGRFQVRRNHTRHRLRTPNAGQSIRSIPMSDRVQRELQAHHQRTLFGEGEDLVFCHPLTGKTLNPSKLRRRFREALRRAGVKDIKFHDLRHTFGTHCAAAGVPLLTLQEWMGHLDLKTTSVYAAYAPGAHQPGLIDVAFSSEGQALPD